MDLKNLISTIIAIISVVVGAVNAYLQSIGTSEINWFQLVIFVVLAIFGYLQGKNANLTKKSNTQLVEQEKMQKQ